MWEYCVVDDIELTGDVLGPCSLSSCSCCFVMFLSHKNIFQMSIPPIVKPDPHMKFFIFFSGQFHHCTKVAGTK